MRLPSLAQIDKEIARRKAEAELDEERLVYEDDLYEFLRSAWKYVDASPWIDSWAVEAAAEHLQAVVDGDIKRLIINIPPRFGKSSLCSVALPAWCWAQRHRGPTSGPGVAFLHASYAEKLSVRDSVKCRRLINSPWYKRLWGNRFSLTGDQNAKTRFSNTEQGERLITSIGAGVTGEGGNIIVCDDPNAANEVGSEATIASTIDWWDQTMSTRLNDPKTGAYIIVQQRLAENDLTGHILENDSKGEWTHLCLPMRFETDRSFVTSIGWQDPRTKEGQLLCEERFDEASVASLERSLGPWGSAGQMQQRPEPKGGGIIKREWWKLWEDDKAFPPMDYILASLDTAYTEREENDPSAMTIWGIFTTDPVAIAHRMIDADGRPQYIDRAITEMSPKVMLMSAWRERLEFHDLVQKVIKTCKPLKVDKLIVENKAAGISTAQEIRRLLAGSGMSVELYDPKGLDKQARLYSVQHIYAEGLVYAPDRQWAEMTITEVSQFPKGRYRDLTDTCSQALRRLRDMGMLTRSPERAQEIEDAKQYTRPATPLYPA